MRLNLYTDFGFRALMLLGSSDGDWMKSDDLANTLGIPRNHLLKIVNRMVQLGWIESKPGRSGGFRFQAAARDVRVSTVVDELEQNMDLVECFDELNSRCPLSGACRLAPLLKRAGDAFMAELGTTTVGELLPSPRSKHKLIPLQTR